MSNIPNELLYYIYHYLEIKDKLNFRLVNKLFCSISLNTIKIMKPETHIFYQRNYKMNFKSPYFYEDYKFIFKGNDRYVKFFIKYEDETIKKVMRKLQYGYLTRSGYGDYYYYCRSPIEIFGKKYDYTLIIPKKNKELVDKSYCKICKSYNYLRYKKEKEKYVCKTYYFM
jgi:hypothetical protein